MSSAGVAAVDWATLRPMGFGRKPARSVRNPVIEPLWAGRRVLVRVEESGVELRDETGLPLAGHPALQGALVAAAAVGGSSLILDGYLVDLPPLDAALSAAGGDGLEMPSLGEVTRTMALGRRGGRQPASPTRPREGVVLAAGANGEPRALSFVAVDMLALDGDALLDVPLLERKRLLDAALSTGELVRRGPHVRPPAEAWFRQWRALGFREVAVKDANSRYAPGSPSPDWTLAPIPQP